VRSTTTYHILLAKFEEFPIELYALKLTMGFQQWLAYLSPSWLVNKASSLSQHLAKQGFDTWHRSTSMWKTSLENPWQPNHIQNNIWWYQEVFLAKSETLSISHGRNQITSTLRFFSNTNVNCTWGNHWLHHNASLLLPTTPQTINLPLKLGNGQLSLSLEMLDYATFAPIIQLKLRHISCWNVPYITH
jgi:hypothetical protein